MDAIKVEPDTDSLSESIFSFGGLEFFAVKHERNEEDPLSLAETLEESEIKDGLRNFISLKQEFKEEVKIEENEVGVNSAPLQISNRGQFNCGGMYSLSQYNTCFNNQQQYVRSSDLLRVNAFQHGTQINNSPSIIHSTCGTSERLFSDNDFESRSRTFPFKCELCAKTFLFKSHLKKHMRSHTGEKPYTCIACNRSFAHTVTLKNHLRVHTGEKPYSCTDCTKSFSTKLSLLSHISNHTGGKQYKCDVCSKLFSVKLYLVNHIRSHMDVKLFNCALCKKKFSRRSALIKHLRSHTISEPYL